MFGQSYELDMFFDVLKDVDEEIKKPKYHVEPDEEVAFASGFINGGHFIIEAFNTRIDTAKEQVKTILNYKDKNGKTLKEVLDDELSQFSSYIGINNILTYGMEYIALLLGKELYDEGINSTFGHILSLGIGIYYARTALVDMDENVSWNNVIDNEDMLEALQNTIRLIETNTFYNPELGIEEDDILNTLVIFYNKK